MVATGQRIVRKIHGEGNVRKPGNFGLIQAKFSIKFYEKTHGQGQQSRRLYIINIMYGNSTIVICTKYVL